MISGEVILTYGDATIRKSDQNLFKKGQWLNDNCISFFYEYLKHIDENDDIVLIDPAVSGYILFENDFEDLLDSLKSLKIEEKKYAFIPINDKTDKYQAGGTHWALLVYLVCENQFIYLDSVQGMIDNTQDIAIKLENLRYQKEDKNRAPEIKAYKNIPKQNNGFDCGVFVLCYTEILVKNLKETILEDKKENFAEITQEYITKKRSELYDLIDELCKKSSKYTF